MRILIGILYCIENEFEDCISAIKRQTHKDFEYFVIRDLPNKQAHDKLYSSFMEKANEFDLFIKIDADMVLCRDDFFEKTIEVFEKNAKLQLLKTTLKDFFTNTFIGSLNIYRSNVIWNINNDETFFPDRIDNVEFWEDDHYGLSPSAWHSPNPSSFQAFHFGVHKAVKVMQFQKVSKNYNASCEHWNNYTKTRENYFFSKDKKLGIAICGAEIAFRQKFTSIEIDFKNSTLLKEFKKIENLTEREINNIVNGFSFSSFSFLPSKWRQDVLFRVKSKCIFSISNILVLRYLLKMLYYTVKTKIVK